MRRTVEKRIGAFKWESKAELYSYFSARFALSKVEVDREIDAALANFKLRAGKTIEPKELWQKVGMSLERKAIRSTSEIGAQK
jgi:hypothetical protein